VLAEFAGTLRQKITPAARPQGLAVPLDALGPIKLIPLDGDVVHRAVQAHYQYDLHYYDGMMLATAERRGGERIWSEDLHAGQKYFGVVVEEPFA
jgi:predicted nucleic acid-binding protein